MELSSRRKTRKPHNRVECMKTRAIISSIITFLLFLCVGVLDGSAAVADDSGPENPHRTSAPDTTGIEENPIMTIGYIAPQIRENPLLRREERSRIVSPPAHTGSTTLGIFFLLLLIMLSVGLVLTITLT